MKEDTDLLNELMNAGESPAPTESQPTTERETVALLVAQGLSDELIGKAIGKPPSYVAKLRQTSWFPKVLDTMLERLGKTRVEDLLQARERECYRTYFDLMNSTTQPGSVRKACADAILTRLRGKPSEAKPDDTSDADFDSVEAQEAEIDKQLASMNAELQRLGATKSHMTTSDS